MSDHTPAGTPPDQAATLHALMQRHHVRPRKELGQHFLADPNILNKIVQAAELPADTTVVEIGPGPGTLTRHLARAAGLVIAVELDDAMVNLLRQEMAALPNVEIVHGDILKLDPPALVRQRMEGVSDTPAPPYAIVANLPYYITSAAIRHLLEAAPPPFRIVLTIQLEVAQRIVAAPGQMSLLAVSVQLYGAPRIMARIPAGAFVPPPQVDSAVLRIDTYSSPPVALSGRNDFFRVVRAGFGQKRKQLKNALSAGLGLPGADVTAAMTGAGIAPQRRAETLSLSEWAALTRALSG